MYTMTTSGGSKNSKAAGPDGIPNEILKTMPEAFHDATHAFLAHMGSSMKTAASWKTSHTILLYKKGDPQMVKSYRPIALANTVYKRWTSIVTTLDVGLC
jgi:ABC-type thiamine transport system substrate-binding protein